MSSLQCTSNLGFLSSKAIGSMRRGVLQGSEGHACHARSEGRACHARRTRIDYQTLFGGPDKQVPPKGAIGGACLSCPQSAMGHPTSTSDATIASLRNADLTSRSLRGEKSEICRQTRRRHLSVTDREIDLIISPESRRIGSPLDFSWFVLVERVTSRPVRCGFRSSLAEWVQRVLQPDEPASWGSGHLHRSVLRYL